MTLAEFKAWFEGFTEGMDGTPSDKQWERIKKRVKEIDGSPVTERVFIDRYWPQLSPPRPWWGVSVMNASGVHAQQYHDAMQANAAGSHSASFNSMHAMTALGRTDFEDAA